jgi:hypothetical protein
MAIPYIQVAPDGITPISTIPVTSASSGNVAAAVATATLAAVTGKTNYITGFEITGAGATAGAVVSPTVTGVLGGTLTYTYASVTGPTLLNPTLAIAFTPPLAATGQGVAIAVSCPSLGAGNTNTTVVAHGYSLGPAT